MFSVNKLILVCLLVSAVSALPNPGEIGYNQYSAGAGAGAYAQTSGGSVHTGNQRPGLIIPPRGGHSSGYSSGEFNAKGGFVAGGGSVSGSYDKGYNNAGYRG